MPSESREMEINLSDLEDSRSNHTESPDPTVMGVNASLNLDHDGPTDIGLLPMIDYLFEKANIWTTIFMDEGSNTSFITTKLAESLHLEGEFELTKIFKAGEEIA